MKLILKVYHMGIYPSSLLQLHEFNFCFETEVSVTQKQSYIKQSYVDQDRYYQIRDFLTNVNLSKMYIKVKKLQKL